MEVHFTPEQEAQISRIAGHAGVETEQFVIDAAMRLIERKQRFIAVVEERVAMVDPGGELVEDDEVRLWLEQRERF